MSKSPSSEIAELQKKLTIGKSLYTEGVEQRDQLHYNEARRLFMQVGAHFAKKKSVPDCVLLSG
jgi:hypothetical protein